MARYSREIRYGRSSSIEIGWEIVETSRVSSFDEIRSLAIRQKRICFIIKFDFSSVPFPLRLAAARVEELRRKTSLQYFVEH